MNYALIAPLGLGVKSNPGCHFITAGIKYWLRGLDANAVFTMVEMLHDDPEGWELAEKQANKIVLCGNPRFNSTEEKVYWDWQIWGRIVQLMDRGIPFIDAWAGSAWPFDMFSSAEDVAAKLLKIRKNAAVLKHESRAELLIARDRPTEILLRSVNPNTQLLPCSSYFAALEYKIERHPKEFNAIVLRRLPGYEWILDKALSLQARIQPCRFVVHTHADWKWAAGLNPLCLTDPVELLSFYARVGTLHSFRLHASIPAHSLGATVTDYEIDSRSLTLAPFGLTAVPFTRFGQ